MPGTEVWMNILQARTIFEKATKVNYKQVDDLAVVWCEYGEMELRHENYEQALRILRVRHIFYSTHTARCVFFLFFLSCDETNMCWIVTQKRSVNLVACFSHWCHDRSYRSFLPVFKLSTTNDQQHWSYFFKCPSNNLHRHLLADRRLYKKENPLWI